MALQTFIIFEPISETLANLTPTSLPYFSPQQHAHGSSINLECNTVLESFCETPAIKWQRFCCTPWYTSARDGKPYIDSYVPVWITDACCYFGGGLFSS